MRRLVRLSGLTLIIAVAFTVFSMGLASQVGAVSLDFDSDQFLGSIDPDGGSEVEQAAQINVLIAQASPSGPTLIDGQTYTRSDNPCGPPCPAATAVGSVKDDTANNEGNFGGGFTYLKAKYATSAFIWYVEGLSGDFDIPETCAPTACGLSHWVLFNPSTNVSEPSTTLLLGLAFAGVAFFGRKFLART